MSWRKRVPCSSRKGGRRCGRQLSRALGAADAAAAPGRGGLGLAAAPIAPGQPRLTPSFPGPLLPPLFESPELRPKTGFCRKRYSEPRGPSAPQPPPAPGWSGSAPQAGCATGAAAPAEPQTAGSGVSRRPDRKSVV